MDRFLRTKAAKPVVFALCLAPLLWLAWRAVSGDLGANPIEALIRYIGDWALRFLLIALAVTPVRTWTGWSGLARLRRMLGLFAFAYVVLHFSAYVGLDQFFDWQSIGREIVKRRYITLGMVAVVLLVPLAVTSTDAWLRRLGGRRWRVLHRVVYVIAPLGVAHHWLMVKKDLREPMIHAAVLAVLLGWRALAAWRKRRHNDSGAVTPESRCAVSPQHSSRS